MASHNSRDKGSLAWTRDSPLTKKFVCLFYGILNNYPEHLHYFYGPRSRVAISEFGPASPPRTESTETKEELRELLKRFYKDVKVVVKNAIPQVSVEEGVLLVVSGTLTRTLSTSNNKEEHSFTQSLMLAPQKHGYYVLTDTLHIMHGGSDGATVAPFNWVGQGDATENASCFFYPEIETCPPKANPTRVIKIKEEVAQEKENVEGPSGDNPPTSPESTAKLNLKQPQENETEKANEEKAKTTNKLQTPPHKFQPPAPQRVHPARHPRSFAPKVRDPAAVPLTGVVGVPPGRSFTSRAPSNVNEGRPKQGPPGRGVFIARLPFGISAEEVVKAFSIFGPIVNGADGIQVRDGRNGCYAFLTFESTNAAQAAIQNGAVVHGKRVFVEARNTPQENVEAGFATVHVPLPTNCVLPQLRPPHSLPTMVPLARPRPN